MSDTLELQAALTTTPTIGNPSGVPAITIPVQLELSIVNKSIQQFDMTTDSPYSLDLSSFPNGVNVVQIQTLGGRVTAAISSEKGAGQLVPVDPFYFQCDQAGSISTIDLTRDAGVETNVYVFLASLS